MNLTDRRLTDIEQRLNQFNGEGLFDKEAYQKRFDDIERRLGELEKGYIPVIQVKMKEPSHDEGNGIHREANSSLISQ